MNVFRPLHDGWSLTALAPSTPHGAGTGPEVPAGTPVDGRTVPATVPGCVHTDLLAAGLIDDPYLDDNEAKLAWIGRAGWRYETTFEHTDAGDERVDLVCRGLDTVATVLLNDVEVARTANMHRSYRWNVRGRLVPGTNRLTVLFDPARRYAEQLRDELGDRPHAYDEPFNFIRKMACNFGWDWGPILTTAGIWQPIGLESWSVARLAEVRPLVTVAGHDGTADGTVEVLATVEWAGGSAGTAPVTVVAEVAGVRAEVPLAAGETTATVRLTVPRPRLWWPRGHGEQARYPLTVTLRQGAAELDRWERKIGFRTVRLDTSVDEIGRAYTVVVNDLPLFVRGVNWIPDDCFPTRITRDRLAARFDQAVAANVNYLRVWGGGLYETEDFYDLADEYGLLVGQDFLLACAAYPEEEPFASEIAAEAREQVARLTPHPSLAVWTGNNENIWGYHDWGWAQELAGRTWGERYYHEVFPAIVAELDPTRPYWPGSPYSGSPELHPNEPDHGTMHIWDTWNAKDYTVYREYQPRFVSEFGFQAPATYATIRRAISDEPLTPDSPGMLSHQKQEDGNDKLRARLAEHLPVPTSFDDWHYATQLNQARAIGFAVEHFRSLRPRCMGTILWQINDCWPVSSWAIVDGDGRRKPVWYALRRSYADRLLTIQPRSERPALVAVNDGVAPWTERVEVARCAVDGRRLETLTVDLDVAAGSQATVELPDRIAVAGDPTTELIVAGSGPDRALWTFVGDVDLAAPAPEYEAEVEPVDGGYAVTVTARTLLRDLVLYPDRLDPAAEADRALVTLLPGEATTFTVSTTARLDPAALTTTPVLRSAGQLLTGD